MGTRRFLLAVALIVTGCTHEQLRYNTVNQAQTTMDIHQQQVLNNLAMFVADPNALPHFGLPTEGLTDVTDLGRADVGLDWVRVMSGAFLFTGIGVDGSAQRTAKENWTMTPIADPRKLELMRCAYRRAVEGCSCTEFYNGSCLECKKRWNVFYHGDPNGISEEANVGSVDEDCLGSCWFQIGCKKCVPKDCDYVGRYRDVYLWVLPGFSRDQLTKLTLAILDYAVYDAPEPATMEITLYRKIDEEGKEVPTTSGDAQKVIRAIVPLDVSEAGPPEETKSDQPWLYRNEGRPSAPAIRYRSPRRTPNPGSGLIEFQQRLQTVQ